MDFLPRGGLPSLITIAVSLGACDLIPGTAANQEKRGKELAAQLLIDPSSAQYRNVVAREDAVCGEINGKNRMGAYVGFSRFYVDAKKWSAVIDPQFDFDNLDSARRLCASIGGSSCTNAVEEEGRRLDQIAFDTFWSGKCDTTHAASRAPFDPTLPSQVEENWTEEQPNGGDEGAAHESDDETWFEAPDPDRAVDLDGADLSQMHDDNGLVANNTDPTEKE